MKPFRFLSALLCLTVLALVQLPVRAGDGGGDRAERTGTPPEGFTADATVSYKGSLYLSGTRAGANAFYRFNPSTGQYKELPPCPGPVLAEGSALVCQHDGREDALYLIGGQSRDSDSLYVFGDQVWAFLPAHHEWQRKCPLSDLGKDLRLTNASAVASGSAHILVFSGDGRADGQGTVYAYHTITDTWTVLAEKPVSFGWANYLILILYLLAMTGLGFCFSRKNDSSDHFFKGGSNLPWWAAGISIFATALSAITFLSVPAKSYATDWGMFVFSMMTVAVVPIVARFYLPLFHKLKVASVYEYLETRFSRPVRALASAFFCIFMFARVAIVLFLPSLALNAVTGIDIYLCILLMGIITLAYCTMGGIKAVVWGDVIQGFLLVGGAILSFIWIIHGIDGGFSGFFQVASQQHKFHILDFRFDWTQPVFWVAILGGLSNSLLTYTSDQSIVQKYLTVKDTKEMERSLWLNALLTIPISILFFGIGTALFVFFRQRPELLSVGMSHTDSIFPHYMMCQLPDGIRGLLVAAVFAATMSTIASNINSSTTVLSEDFYAKWKKDVTDRGKVRFARIAGIFVGGLGILMAIALATYDIASLWDQFNFFLGLLTSGLGGLFLMGIASRRIGTRAALTGFAGSIVVLLLINATTPVSAILYGFLGLVSCYVIGYLSSFLYGYGK